MNTKNASRRQTESTPGSGAPANTSPSREAIALAASYRADRRDFALGGEFSDWLLIAWWTSAH